MGKNDWMYTSIYQSDRAGEGAEKDKWSKETIALSGMFYYCQESQFDMLTHVYKINI